VHALVERQLIEVLQEVEALQELLQELPAIYEEKYQARLRTLRDEQVDLERTNQALRRRLLVLAPGSDPDLLPLQPRGLLAPAIRSALRLKKSPSGGALSDAGLTTAESADPTRR